MGIRIAKVRRVLRRLPKAWLHEMVEPLFNRGQVLTFFVGVIGLWLILQTATPEERDVQAFDWAISLQAFGWSLMFWAAVSLIRAPIMIIRADRQIGTWHGSRFVFHDPLLIFTKHCKPTGQIEAYNFKVTDAEAGSFIYYKIQLDGSDRAEISLGSYNFLGVIPSKNWPGTGGTKLAPDKEATLLIRLPTEADATTVRIYLRSFVVGEPDDQDGETGNYHFPIRSPLGGDGGRPAA